MRLMRYLNNQAELQQMLNYPMGINTEVAIKENILALIVEATEILNTRPWKPWRKTAIVPNKQKSLEEVIDLFKFAFNVLNELHVTEEEFDKAWVLTNEKIAKRFNNDY